MTNLLLQTSDAAANQRKQTRNQRQQVSENATKNVSLLVHKTASGGNVRRHVMTHDVQRNMTTRGDTIDEIRGVNLGPMTSVRPC